MSAWAHDGGRWLHRPWWKVAANTVLRAFQSGPRKVVIYTRCEPNGQRAPARTLDVVGYGFGFVLHEVPR